jgi:hypothetical protein
MRIKKDYILYSDSEADIDGAKDYIARYGLSSKDVKIIKLHSGGIIIKTKENIDLVAIGD